MQPLDEDSELTESPIKSVDHGNRASVTAATTNFSDLHGYLKKKSRHDRWQKRWFEANDHYLTYYKSPQSEKLLACIDLYQTGAIKLATERDDDTGDDARSEFSLELGDRFYIIKAETPGDAKRWVEGLNERKKPKEAKKTPSGSSPAKKTPQGEGRFTSFIVSPDGTSTDKNALTEAMEKAANTVENEAAGDNVGEDTKGSEDALTKEGGAGCCTIM